MPDPNLPDPNLNSAGSELEINAVSSVELVPGGAVNGSIRPPGSKSLTNRALICASMAKGESTINGALASEDTEVMIDALQAIGAQVLVRDGGRRLLVEGLGSDLSNDERSAQRKSIGPQELYMANSGTSIRFLTAALSAAGGSYRLVGVSRMHQRPIGDLVGALQDVIDGEIEALSPDGCPPVKIESRGWSGRLVEVAGAVSSQFLSGLMMAAPIVSRLQTSPSNREPHPTQISVKGELVSRPYVEMTAEVMRSFGAKVELIAGDPDANESLVVEVAAIPYVGTDYEIEPDASAASYFWATAAITGGQVTVGGLAPNAMQGDVGFCRVLEQMGCTVTSTPEGMTVAGGELRGVDVDMNAISDTVQTLAVVALFADGPTRVRGVAHNRFKETDRIGDLACELRKLGATVDEHDDGMTIHPPSHPNGATLETYHDHRMAMSLSLTGLRIPGVRILDPACTSKTYPEFFADMEQLTGRSHLWSNG